MIVGETTDAELGENIRVWAKLSGIGKPLDNEDYELIKLVLKQTFSHLEIKFINNGFVHYAAGKLGELEHYGTFSPKFVGLIIKAYKELNRVNRTIKQLKPIEVAKQLENKVNPLEENKRAFDFIKRVFEKDNELPTIANWAQAFRHAEMEGLIILSKQEKKELYNQLAKSANNRMRQAKSMGADFRSISIELKENSLKSECCKYLLEKYFC